MSTFLLTYFPTFSLIYFVFPIILYIFATIKVLSGLAHVKLMPVGGWCDKRFCRMKNAKITVSSFGNGSIEQVFEYANHGLFHSFLGDYAL